MTEATQQPADVPQVGAVYNYEGQNYEVTRVDPKSFVVFGNDDEWTPAIEFTDHVSDAETATVDYVMALDLFVESYELGVIEEGAENAPPEASETPDD
jgi:hypothetical protein